MDKILQIVVFYPCHGIKSNNTHNGCTAFIVDEWWGATKDEAYKDKRRDLREFPTVEDGLEFYKGKMPGDMKVYRCDPKTGKYEGPEDYNVSVTNSHTICSKCKEVRNEERERYRATLRRNDN